MTADPTVADCLAAIEVHSELLARVAANENKIAGILETLQLRVETLERLVLRMKRP